MATGTELKLPDVGEKFRVGRKHFEVKGQSAGVWFVNQDGVSGHLTALRLSNLYAKATGGDKFPVRMDPAVQKAHEEALKALETPEAPGGPAEAPEAGETKSDRKAAGFAAKVEALGWTVKAERPGGDLTEVLATRGDEGIFIAWADGRMIANPMPTYTISHRTIQMRNASQALQFAARAPETASAELARVASNKSFKKRAPSGEPKRYLPFDPATAEDDEIMVLVLGQKVAWMNDLTNTEETTRVSIDPRFLQVRVRPDGERVVWCCSDTGFRAFRVSALTRVTGRAR